ncbi:MAG: hypothetical protein WAM73_18105 [Desulfobacterales bacterium]
MVKQNKKIKRRQNRKVRIKQEKSRRQALPALLRKDPLLREALSYHHPLVDCRINKDWRETKSASIYVVRAAPTGKILSAFLVDLLECGLKNVWGDFGASRSELEEMWDEAQRRGVSMVPCDYALAHRLVHGGISWARNNGLRLPKELQIWIRLMEPGDDEETDLALFGDTGRPLELFKQNGSIDLEVLRAPLALDGADLPAQILTRIGDIKAALVDFFKRPEYHQVAEVALFKRYGPDWKSCKDADWINLIDALLLEQKLADGKSIARQFVETHSGIMSDDVSRLILGWQDVLQGFFEIEGHTGDRLDMFNLINERRYRVFSTIPQALAGLGSGDFLAARIVPAGRFNIFSGRTGIYKWDGTPAHRAAMYRFAVDLQIEFPDLAFRDNDEKLIKSRDFVREQHEAFVEVFSGEEIVAPGVELEGKYRQFVDDWNRNHTVKEGEGQPFPPDLDLPSSILRDPAAGLLSDPVEGLLFLKDYGDFLDLFARPRDHIGRPETVEFLFDYLESPGVSDVPFRRVQKRFPEAFKKMLDYYQDEFDVTVKSVDDLMRIYKPQTFDKLPGNMVMLDSEIIRIALQETEERIEIARMRKNKEMKTWEKPRITR